MSLALEMFAVAGVTRLILGFLDLSAIETIVHVFESTSWPLGCLNDRWLWTELSRLHFSGQRDVQVVDFSTMEQQGDDGTSRTPSCVELKDFLQTKDERMYFDQTVKVFQGYLGLINDIDGPTNVHLRNHHVGSAQASGRSLNDHIYGPSFRLDGLVWSGVKTPVLDLHMTYKDARNATLQEYLMCKEVVSAVLRMTRMGRPWEKVAQVVLRTIQTCLRANRLDVKVACVCYAKAMLKAFTEQKQDVLDHFNEKMDLRAI